MKAICPFEAPKNASPIQKNENDKMFAEIFQAFLTIFIIMDPFSSFSVFITLTKKFTEKHKKKSADKAVIVAGVLAFVFVFFGNTILNVFSISFTSIKIVGGIVLFILGLEMILSLNISKEKAKNYNVAAVIIATPITTGPGVITSVIIFANTLGVLATSVAVVFSLFFIWLILRSYKIVHRLFGEEALDILSKIMGLLIAAKGIDFILLSL